MVVHHETGQETHKNTTYANKSLRYFHETAIAEPPSLLTNALPHQQAPATLTLFFTHKP